MPPRVQYLKLSIFGIQRVNRQLLRGKKLAANMKPVNELIAADLLRVQAATFESQGRRYGGSWKAIDPVWAARKARLGLDPRILIARGALMKSMSVRDAPFQKLRVDARGIELTSELDYSRVMDEGSPDHGVPARPFTKIHPRDRQRWVKMVEKALRDAIVR
jgi:phage gpG-like protein